MQKLAEKFEDYLFDVLGASVVTEKWQTGERLPFYLRDLYDFFQCSLFDEPLLLLVERHGEEQPSGIVSKHIEQVRKYWNHGVVYVSSSMLAYNRKRFIESKIPFVVPDNQMYLPPLGIDLREYIKKSQIKTKSKISPSTQTVILYALLRETQTEFTPSLLADKLGYSLMSMTRAFDELKAIELGDVFTEGRERFLRFELNKRSLWDKAKDNLHSPVKRRVYVKAPNIEWRVLMSGQTALSLYSMIAQPRIPEYAVSSNEWKSLKQMDELIEIEVPEPEQNLFKIEIWNYEPHLFEQNGVVDPVSLYLSMRNNKDERIQSAIGEMLENFEW